ncbi:LysM peptidoglycan-binding domain-containing protein [Halovulum sp. GXIMD14794]
MAEKLEGTGETGADRKSRWRFLPAVLMLLGLLAMLFYMRGELEPQDDAAEEAEEAQSSLAVQDPLTPPAETTVTAEAVDADSEAAAPLAASPEALTEGPGAASTEAPLEALSAVVPAGTAAPQAATTPERPERDARDGTSTPPVADTPATPSSSAAEEETAKEAAPAEAEQPVELAAAVPPAGSDVSSQETPSSESEAAAESVPPAAPDSLATDSAAAEPEAAATGPAPAPQAEVAAQPGAEVPDAGELAIGTTSDSRPEVATADPTRPPETLGSSPVAPTFDLIRIDAGGSGLVAGRAAPGSVVQVMSGDLTLATVEASSTGEFVAFVQTPDSDEGQVLSLIALTGQQAAQGTEDVLVLPSVQDEAEAPTVVRADEEAVRIVQPSALGKVDGVTLDAISYDQAGEVRLSGRAPGPQAIRIYLDGASVGAVRASEAGTWDATVEGIDAGRYVLRVDALKDDGSVASRAESPFQRVYPTAEQRENPGQVTVQPGNNLWLIARDRYGDGILYTQIYAANREAIRDPDLIYPGQIFALPDETEFTR